jgi:succinoglycan biosynthesis protein ExoL
MTANILYFAHDLADAAVHRRVRMLLAAGANVTPIGFRRGPSAIKVVEDVQAIDLGETRDGMLARRALSVVAALAKLDIVADYVRQADVLLARNLEMLVLAWRARRRYAPFATLAYECLDIHRKLLSKNWDGALLRSLESRLWRDVDLLLTSSPAFVRNYFAPRGFAAPVKLVENKFLMLEDNYTKSPKRLPGPPWRIGWFGVIRCRQSLDILSSLAEAMEGAVEIVIRGRPSSVIFADFDKTIAGRPHVRYAGSYRNPLDLASIYGDVHFVWTIDYYESGQNSAWLLPNRLYEGTFHGAVPIGLTNVETAAWLAQRGLGVVLDEPLEKQLYTFFKSLDQDVYARLAMAADALPNTDLVSNRMDCRELVKALCQPVVQRTGIGRGDNVAEATPGPNSNSLEARR